MNAINTPNSYLTIENGQSVIKDYTGRIEYKCCGKVKYVDGHNVIESTLCADCQEALIGQRVTVVRYGDIPTGGKSYNHRDGKNEAGVSCYLHGMSVRPEFSEGRNKLEFSAIIIGWGGDDEPLIDAATIQ
jgi:hypothetical protein